MVLDYLVLGDIHFPYENKQLFPYLKAIKKYFRPKRVISIGDEVDHHAISYHETSPAAHGAKHEFLEAREKMWELEKLWPMIDILESNHGSLHQRKARSGGVPKHYLKDYKDLWGCKSFKWHFEMVIKLESGKKVYLHHGKTKDVLKASKSTAMSMIQGHFHEQQGVQYWSNPFGSYFAANTGCLIDSSSFAYAYSKNNVHKPSLGCIGIVGDMAFVIPLTLDKKGKWTGRLL